PGRGAVGTARASQTRQRAGIVGHRCMVRVLRVSCAHGRASWNGVISTEVIHKREGVTTSRGAGPLVLARRAGLTAPLSFGTDSGIGSCPQVALRWRIVPRSS